MDPYPTAHELVTLFECEPRLMDPELSWHHNTVDLVWTGGPDRVEVTVEASYGELFLRWIRDGVDRLELRVRGVEGLAVEIERGREALRGTIRGPAPRQFRLQLKPHVAVLWSTD